MYLSTQRFTQLLSALGNVKSKSNSIPRFKSSKVFTYSESELTEIVATFSLVLVHPVFSIKIKNKIELIMKKFFSKSLPQSYIDFTT